jgi:uncharacterized membrane protein YbhN (UPF0104 family)
VKKFSSKKIISYFILIAFCLFAFHFTSKNTELFSKIKQFNLSGALIISAFVVMVLVLNGWRTKILTEIFTKKKIRFTEWFGLSIINTLGNYSPFQGGIVARGYYLKNFYKVPYLHFLSSMIASIVITFSTYSVVCSIVLVINFLLTGFFSLLIFIFFVAIGSAGFFSLFLLPKINLTEFDNKPVSYLKSFLDGWEAIINGKNVVLRLIGIDLILGVVLSLRYFSASKMIGAGISYLQSIVISMTATVALLVNITPGALGIREAIAGFSAQLLGSNMTTGFFVASVERVMIVFCVFGLGIPFSYYFNRKINKEPEKRFSETFLL